MADKIVKKRNWTFIVYPDSAPQNWREILEATGLPSVISPLHDKDINPTGEPKKPHYHVMVCYNGPTSYNVVLALSNGQLGQTIPKPIESIEGMYDYLTHENNPEKAQYSKADILCLNGFRIRDYVELKKSEVAQAKREVLQLIRDNGITEYADLMDILMDGGEDTADMFDVASNNTMFFTKYLTSQWRRASNSRVRALHDLANPEEESRDTNQRVTHGDDHGTE